MLAQATRSKAANRAARWRRIGVIDVGMAASFECQAAPALDVGFGQFGFRDRSAFGVNASLNIRSVHAVPQWVGAG